MPYEWEQWVDGEWRPVSSGVLPEWMKNKKAAMWAGLGREVHRADASGREQRYRLVKGETEADGEGSMSS